MIVHSCTIVYKICPKGMGLHDSEHTCNILVQFGIESSKKLKA